MNELGAARVLYGFMNRRTQGNDSARTGQERGSARVMYGTVTFVGDGMTPYTYTAADGIPITTTPGPGEYAILLDSGETVVVTSAIPLSVGDRVALTYQNGVWVITANESTSAYVERNAADLQRDYIKRIEDEGKRVTDEVNGRLDPFREDYDSFKESHSYSDSDIDKRVTDSADATRTAYEAAISDGTKSLASKSELETGLNGIKSTLTEYYKATKNDDGTTSYEYDSERHSELTQTIDQVASVVGKRESLADGINALAKAQSESTITQASDEIKSAINGMVVGDDGKSYVTETAFQQTKDGFQLSIDKAVGSVSIEYATSTSATTSPTSGWSTSSPEWSEGTYAWQRTTVTNTSGVVTSQEVTCIQGAKGKDGTGRDGKGVSSVRTQYASSNNGTSAPGQTSTWWENSVPSWDSRYPYYWRREVTAYTDGTTGFSAGIRDYTIEEAYKNAAGAASDASAAKADAAEAKAVTKRFTFADEGFKVTTASGDTILEATYDSDGFGTINNIANVRSDNSILSAKDWGVYYGNTVTKNGSATGDDNVHFWLTEGRQKGKYPESPVSQPAMHFDAAGLSFDCSGDGFTSSMPWTPPVGAALFLTANPNSYGYAGTWEIHNFAIVTLAGGHANVLNVNGGKGEQGDNVQIWPYDDTDGGKWYLWDTTRRVAVDMWVRTA